MSSLFDIHLTACIPQVHVDYQDSDDAQTQTQCTWHFNSSCVLYLPCKQCATLRTTRLARPVYTWVGSACIHRMVSLKRSVRNRTWLTRTIGFLVSLCKHRMTSYDIAW
ncbi:hypothetical protein CY34DRAFT_569703 [Suillus luteus UH-Slu-Lm8-n1]|uniref:Uncharacterized protein n=1 Tax=Suillus luteus UH-Slu-Lm8-n1 TaxID=930992 RepID=A0A0C9ZDG9_9AGAM|nr:hypothetical protein CY34DRAFT_569703 [Suillus luteus UH-Slu-Lm8-n1]